MITMQHFLAYKKIMGDKFDDVEFLCNNNKGQLVYLSYDTLYFIINSQRILLDNMSFPFPAQDYSGFVLGGDVHDVHDAESLCSFHLRKKQSLNAKVRKKKKLKMLSKLTLIFF